MYLLSGQNSSMVDLTFLEHECNLCSRRVKGRGSDLVLVPEMRQELGLSTVNGGL